MDVKRLVVLGVLFVVLVILAIIFFLSGGEEKIKQVSPSSILESDALSSEPHEMKKITLFFLSEKDTLLHPEEREIVVSSSIIQQARHTVEELLNGSRNGSVSPFPPETKLRELFMTREGIVYVDFSREIQERHLSGASAEILTIYSIVNSLTVNFESVKRVFILIDGDERETLRGHVDLSRPLLPRFDLIAN